VDIPVRRAAFERYARDSAGLHLPYHDISWLSGRRLLPTTPVIPTVMGPDVDHPALAVENVGGVLHLGATMLQGPPNAREDGRIVITSLADARRMYPVLLARVQHKIVRRRANRFVALATAFQNCGAFIHVPSGVVLDAPIQLVWMHGAGRVQAVFPHIVVSLGVGARATVLERHVGESDAFICGIVEGNVEADADLEYVVVQQCGDGARIHIMRAVRCEREARVGLHLAELGGAHVRTALDAHLDAPRASADLTAFFLNTGMRCTDITSIVDHRSEHTLSSTVLRCAANDRARGTYTGIVRMRANAHGGDGALRADGLLLSKHARIDTKPELDICANNVRAYHGATVGTLDEEALFYVQARGISRSEAVRLITLAFFEPAVTRFPSAALQDEIRTALDQRIDEATEPEHASSRV
jgi:Fe-S cluster assembly protein SufD